MSLGTKLRGGEGWKERKGGHGHTMAIQALVLILKVSESSLSPVPAVKGEEEMV